MCAAVDVGWLQVCAAVDVGWLQVCAAVMVKGVVFSVDRWMSWLRLGAWVVTGVCSCGC